MYDRRQCQPSLQQLAINETRGCGGGGGGDGQQMLAADPQGVVTRGDHVTKETLPRTPHDAHGGHTYSPA